VHTAVPTYLVLLIYIPWGRKKETGSELRTGLRPEGKEENGFWQGSGRRKQLGAVWWLKLVCFCFCFWKLGWSIFQELDSTQTALRLDDCTEPMCLYKCQSTSLSPVSNLRPWVLSSDRGGADRERWMKTQTSRYGHRKCGPRHRTALLASADTLPGRQLPLGPTL